MKRKRARNATEKDWRETKERNDTIRNNRGLGPLHIEKRINAERRGRENG